MKASKTLVFAVLAATALAGCTNDEGEASVPDLAGTPIRIHTNLLERSLTRAGYPAGELKEGSFGLFLTTTGAEDDQRYNATNMQFSYTSGGEWTSEEQLLWKNNSAEVSYYAYMPYDDAATADPTNYTVSVPEDQSTDEDKIKEADFLYYKSAEAVTATSNKEKPGAIDIEFQHQLSYFTVKLKRLDTAKGVTFSSVTLRDCATSATFDLTTGTHKVKAESGNISMLHIPAATGDETDVFECILIPQEFSYMTILITGTDTGTNTEKVYKYVSAAEGPTLASGKSYTLELNVGNTVTRVGTVSVSEWDTEGGWTEQGDTDEWNGIDAATHTIDLSQAGQLTTALIEEAVAGESGITLTISGPMDDTGAMALKYYFDGEYGTKETHVSTLDMRGVTGLTEIKDATFRDATYLKEVMLPASVTSIASRAFSGTGLETFTAEHVTSVGDVAAFMDCTNLKELSLPSVTTFGEGVSTLCNCPSLTTLRLTSPGFDGVFSSNFFGGTTSTQNVDLYIHKNLKNNVSGTTYFLPSGSGSRFTFKSITLVDDNGDPVDESTLE